jgi:hypothetical protein
MAKYNIAVNMSSYVPVELVPGVIESIINETSNRLIIIYPFSDVPVFIRDALQERANRAPLNLVFVFSNSVLRNNLLQYSKIRSSSGYLEIEVRVINQLYNCCFVNDANLLMLLPESETDYFNASFGWQAGVNNTSSDIYHETLLYINDIMKKSHRVFQ